MIVMTADELMKRADQLSGCHPGLSSHEIQDLFHSLDMKKLKAAYLLNKMKETEDPAERAEAKRSLSILGASEQYLKGFINQGLAGEKIVYKRSVEPKPKKRRFE